MLHRIDDAFGLIKCVMKAEKEAKPNIIVDLSNTCTAFSPGEVL